MKRMFQKFGIYLNKENTMLNLTEIPFQWCTPSEQYLIYTSEGFTQATFVIEGGVKKFVSFGGHLSVTTECIYNVYQLHKGYYI